MKKLLANYHKVDSDKVVDRLGRDEYKFDKLGQMPELESFLAMRDNERGYRFFIRVFGPAIYGSAFIVDMFAEGRVYAETLNIFTESDEAYGLFVLEDNWDVWHQQATTEFQKDCQALKLDVIGLSSVVNDVISRSESYDDCGNSRSSGDSSVWCDVVGYDNVQYRRRAPSRKIVAQRYSLKGMTETGRKRIKDLEMEVHKDRVEKGEDFYLKLKEVMLPEVISGGQCRQDSGGEEDFRMM
jgi:hypothetical protein